MIIDAFADRDTRGVGTAYVQLPALLQGWHPKVVDTLTQTLQKWSPDYVILGSGFESNTGLYRQLYQRFPVIGSTPDCMDQVKHPLWVSDKCKAQAIPCPATQLESPGEGLWLSKQWGGCGGGHIQFGKEAVLGSTRRYYQQWQTGVSVGILCVVSTEQHAVIGIHLQQHRIGNFMFAGASRCDDPELTAAAETLLQQLLPIDGLQGIISIDTLWFENQLYLLEINPRWSASMRLYWDQPLLQMHLDACRDQRVTIARSADTRAARFCIVYAKSTIDVTGLDFPDWVEDQPGGNIITQDMPLCSLYAQGETPGEVDQALRGQQQKLEDLWGTYVCSNIEFNIH